MWWPLEFRATLLVSLVFHGAARRVLWMWQSLGWVGVFVGCGQILWSMIPFVILLSICKLDLPEIRGVLRNCKGDVLIMLSKYVGVCDSNEAQVLAILEGLRLFSS